MRASKSLSQVDHIRFSPRRPLLLLLLLLACCRLWHARQCRRCRCRSFPGSRRRQQGFELLSQPCQVPALCLPLLPVPLCLGQHKGMRSVTCVTCGTATGWVRECLDSTGHTGGCLPPAFLPLLFQPYSPLASSQHPHQARHRGVQLPVQVLSPLFRQANALNLFGGVRQEALRHTRESAMR